MDDFWRQLLGIVVIIVIVGLVLYFVAPPVIKAFGAAIGLAGGLIGGTVALSTAVASWVVPAGAAGLALGGLAISDKVIQHAKDKPFEWLAPVLGVASGFVLDLCAELFPYEGIFRVLFAGMAGALVVGSGILWRSNKLNLRVISVPMYLVAPVLVLYWAGSQNWSKGVAYTLGQIGLTTWGSLLLFLLLLGLTALLGYFTRSTELAR